MKHLFKIENIAKSESSLRRFVIFDKHKIVDSILKAMAVEAYDVSQISKKLNLKTSDLISIGKALCA